MKRFLSTWSLGKHFVFSLIICLIFRVVGASFKQYNKLLNIGIVDVANGPTSVFVTEDIYYSTVVVDTAAIMVFFIVLALFSPIRSLFKRMFKLD